MDRTLQTQLAVYQAEDGSIRIDARLEAETVWLSLNQLAELFQVDKSGVSRHLKNVFDSKELARDSVVAKFATTAADGKTYQVEHFNLDAIISVGYRVKSRVATHFRQWATSVIREHLLRGYTVDRRRLEENAQELSKALELVRRSVGSIREIDEGRGLVDVISRYTRTFLWLQQYDEGRLAEPEGQRGGRLMTLDEAQTALGELKRRLMARGEATDLFGRGRGDGLAAIWGALEQSAFGEAAYPTLESKAAHLLYFMVKNHPFMDGNKRSAALLLIQFLHENGRLFNDHGEPLVNEAGLAALTLLVAESDPKEKATVIRLILNLLAQGESIWQQRKPDVLESRSIGDGTYYVVHGAGIEPSEKVDIFDLVTHLPKMGPEDTIELAPEHVGSAVGARNALESSFTINVSDIMKGIADVLKKRFGSTSEYVSNAEREKKIIRYLCSKRAYTARQLGSALEMNPQLIKDAYIKPMLQDGQLECLYPGRPNHPKQAYKTVADETAGEL